MAELETEIRLYLDVVLIQNGLLDSFLLVMTGKLMGLNIRAGRIAAGAAALWACVSPFVVPEQGFQLMLAFGPVSVLMVYLAYRERRPKSLLHQAGGLYLTSALMSGGLSLLKRAVYGIVSDGQKGMAQSCLPFLALLSGAGFLFFSACFLWEAAGR